MNVAYTLSSGRWAKNPKVMITKVLYQVAGFCAYTESEPCVLNSATTSIPSLTQLGPQLRKDAGQRGIYIHPLEDLGTFMSLLILLPASFKQRHHASGGEALPGDAEHIHSARL